MRRGIAEGVSALAAVAASAAVVHGAWGRGFPLDDAWIHLVYGLQLARHGTLAYNDGVAATGATSPLWALVAALAHLVVGARGPSMAAAGALKLFGTLAHAAGSALAARCARLATPRPSLAPVVALIAGVLVAVCPLLAFAAVSGMEVGLASALLLASLLAAARGRTLLAGLMVGLAFLARPECILVAPAVFLLLALGAPRWKTGFDRGAAASAITIFFVAALFLRNDLASGRPLPATFYAKAAPVHGSVMVQVRMERVFGDVLGAVAPTSSRLFWALVGIAIVAGVVGVVRSRALGPSSLSASQPEPGVPPSPSPTRGEVSREPDAAAAAAAAALPAAAALVALAYVATVASIVRVTTADIFYFQRYFAPALPLLIVAATSGAATALTLASRLLRALRPRVRLRALVVSCATLGAASVLVELLPLPAAHDRYEADVATIDAVQVALGHFLERATASSAVVWSMDAGAVRYWGQRFVVDLGKLNTPDLLVNGEVRPGYEADAIVTLEGDPIRVVAGEHTLLQVFAVRAPDWPPPPAAPEHTQVVWSCRAGVPESEERVDIVGYPEPRGGRCRAH